MKSQPANALNKPVLDQRTFHQLLAAAYTLQEQNVQPRVKEAKISPFVALAKPTQPTLLVDPAAPGAIANARYRVVRKRISRSNELFWRVATVVAMAAVSALLLGASIDRLSPLPAGLTLTSEPVQRHVPFRRAKPAVTVLSQGGEVGTNVVVMEPHAPTEPDDEPTVVDDEPIGTTAAPDFAQTIVNRNRHYPYESEADMVAPNTLVRYGTPPAVPRVQLQRP